MRRARGGGALAAAALAAALALGPATPARALERGAVEWIEVGDPLLRELELLVATGRADSAVALWSRPVARRDAAAIVARARRADPGSRDPSLVRLERALGDELVARGWAAPAGWTRPLLEAADDTGDGGVPMRLRVSGYADATLQVDEDLAQFDDRSRFGGRLDLESGGLLAHLDVWAGRVAGADEFTDVLVTGSEFAALAEDAYLSYATPAFDVTFGRRRTAFGPGDSGTLLWSPQAAPVTSLALGATLFRHVRATSVHGDVDASRDARIAAHRLEWFPSPKFTLGLSEAARYTSSHWEPLYVSGLLPYTFVQRLLDEDARDRDGPAESTRNNVMASIDVAWRPAAGTQLAGALLLDDQNLRSEGYPTRIGYQFGGLWARPLASLGPAARGTFRAEYSRVYRYVYSTYYGEDFIHHGRPIGYPEGPDFRGFRASFDVATSAAFEAHLAASLDDHGEGTLGEFHDPASGDASGSTLSGVVETTRALEAGARFWPRDGIDLGVTVAHEWVDDVAHQPGVDDRRWLARFTARLQK